jgi:hypothetical protein
MTHALPNTRLLPSAILGPVTIVKRTTDGERRAQV